MKLAIFAPFCALVLTQSASNVCGIERPFANYGVLDIVDQGQPGQISWSGHSSAPWDWLPRQDAPLPGWDQNASQSVEMQFTSEFSIGEDFLLTTSFVLTTTLTAFENDQIVGTIVMHEVAEQGLADLNASHAVVDRDAGTIRVQSGSLLNGGQAITDVSLIETTGIFAEIEQVGAWQGFYSGYYVLPLMTDMELQQNILEAPFVGGHFETAVTGVFAQVPEPSHSSHVLLYIALVFSISRILGVRKKRSSVIRR